MKQDSTYKCFPSSYYLVSTMKSQFIFKQQCTEKLSHPYLYGALKIQIMSSSFTVLNREIVCQNAKGQ